jgi:integrase
MARPISPKYSAKHSAWRSDVGELVYSEKTDRWRRKTVYCHEFNKGQKKEAAQWFRAYVDRRDAQEADAARSAENPSVRQLCEWFLEHSERDNAARTYEQHRVILGQLCRTRHGDRPMRDFTATDLDGLVREWRAAGAKPTTLRTRIGIIGAAFGWACRPVSGRVPEMLLPTNPLAKYQKPIAPRTAERYATRPEVAAFLRYAWRHQSPGPVKGTIDRGAVLFLRVLVHTGARPIEICEARRGDLDLSRGTITLEKWKNSRKTGERRTIFLHRGILRALRRHVTARAGGPADPLFLSRAGAWNTQAIDRRVCMWRRAAIAAGRPFVDKGPRTLNPYMLRHTYISDALMKGIDAATIAKLCGTSVTQIERTYGHLLDAHLYEAAERIARLRRGASG